MNVKDLLVKIQGVPIPQTLSAIANIKELGCCIPNCPNQAEEWHHVKHRKKIKGNDYEKKITAYTAKQIPVCSKHHRLIHKGIYNGPSLRKMKGYVNTDFE
jgi:hypothetical protein